MKKKLFSRSFIALSVILLAGSISSKISAQFASGTGTAEDPYVITTAAQLNDIRNYLLNHFILGNDIDLTDYLASSSAGWEPIGTSSDAGGAPFQGSLNGNGHVISGLWINRPTERGVGLFGWTRYGVAFKYLAVIVSEGKEIKGLDNVGIIAGATNYGSGSAIKITECFASGSVTALGECAGGFYGYTSHAGGLEIVDSYTVGTVKAAKKAGGMLGQAYRRVKISTSYSLATISSDNGSAGGFVADIGFPNANDIRHDFEYLAALNPSVTGFISESSNVGRIVGFEKANVGNGSGNYVYETNYAFADMLVNGAAVTDGTVTNKNGLNKTATELKTETTYAGDNDLYWYLGVTWTMGNGNYPLPILKALPASVQPTTAPSHLGGGSSITLADRDGLALVYPTITTGLVYIKDKDVNAEVKIYDNSGRLLLTSKDSQVDISSFAKGLYLINVQGQTGKVIKK